jgi:hypothetical protein
MSIATSFLARDLSAREWVIAPSTTANSRDGEGRRRVVRLFVATLMLGRSAESTMKHDGEATFVREIKYRFHSSS